MNNIVHTICYALYYWLHLQSTGKSDVGKCSLHLKPIYEYVRMTIFSLVYINDLPTLNEGIQHDTVLFVDDTSVLFEVKGHQLSYGYFNGSSRLVSS